MALPLQHECDPDDPGEAFLWAFVGLPGPRNGPLLLPPQVLAEWSKHLWDLGFRHHPEEQLLEYQPAARDGEHWLGQAGRWVPVGTPPPPTATVPSIAELSVDERRELVRQLQESGELAHLVDRGVFEPDLARTGTFEVEP
ncbi:phage gene 29 protein family protein [Nocardia arthritidis]|uniref:DUF2744 domain-containing protein n=1 Tax=Nocardia arthritidis TaxID=228602 RepID=A0A6G9YTX2_9NOCA|nr:DUF2744 domain-containing protein [Nocardia arthritidis]QIS16590.1 DUF2744 domain-containing protein [Nocardia arthritidis]